jgi:hypothetical protein
MKLLSKKYFDLSLRCFVILEPGYHFFSGIPVDPTGIPVILCMGGLWGKDQMDDTKCGAVTVTLLIMVQ